ncbi:MAG: hypothetical protein R3C12_04930 [Planctomycetaceae bacterium]
MIMAAGAPDGQPHCSARNDIDTIIDDIVRHAQEAATDGEKSHRRQLCRIFRRNLIGCQLQ